MKFIFMFMFLIVGSNVFAENYDTIVYPLYLGQFTAIASAPSGDNWKPDTEVITFTSNTVVLQDAEDPSGYRTLHVKGVSLYLINVNDVYNPVQEITFSDIHLIIRIVYDIESNSFIMTMENGCNPEISKFIFKKDNSTAKSNKAYNAVITEQLSRPKLPAGLLKFEMAK